MPLKINLSFFFYIFALSPLLVHFSNYWHTLSTFGTFYQHFEHFSNFLHTLSTFGTLYQPLIQLWFTFLDLKQWQFTLIITIHIITTQRHYCNHETGIKPALVLGEICFSVKCFLVDFLKIQKYLFCTFWKCYKVACISI